MLETGSGKVVPILKDSIAWMECSIYSIHDAGDHQVVLGQIVNYAVSRKSDPMIFLGGKYGGFAEVG